MHLRFGLLKAQDLRDSLMSSALANPEVGIWSLEELTLETTASMNADEILAILKEINRELEMLYDWLLSLDTRRRLANFLPEDYLRTVVFDFGRVGSTGREHFTAMDTETMKVISLTEKKQKRMQCMGPVGRPSE